MDKQFHPTLYNDCNYLPTLGSKLIHLSKMIPDELTLRCFTVFYYIYLGEVYNHMYIYATQLFITKTEMSFWSNFHHWLLRKLSNWQLPVQQVMEISPKYFRLSDAGSMDNYMSSYLRILDDLWHINGSKYITSIYWVIDWCSGPYSNCHHSPLFSLI